MYSQEICISLLLISTVYSYTISRQHPSDIYTMDDVIDTCAVIQEVQHGGISGSTIARTIDNLLYGTEQDIGLLDEMTIMFTLADNIQSYIYNNLLVSGLTHDGLTHSLINITSQLQCYDTMNNTQQIVTCLQSIYQRFVDFLTTFEYIQTSGTCYNIKYFTELRLQLGNLTRQMNHALCYNGVGIQVTPLPGESTNGSSIHIPTCSEHDVLTRYEILAVIYQLNGKLIQDIGEVNDIVGKLCPYPGCILASSSTVSLSHTLQIIG